MIFKRVILATNISFLDLITFLHMYFYFLGIASVLGVVLVGFVLFINSSVTFFCTVV